MTRAPSWAAIAIADNNLGYKTESKHRITSGPVPESLLHRSSMPSSAERPVQRSGCGRSAHGRVNGRADLGGRRHARSSAHPGDERGSRPRRLAGRRASEPGAVPGVAKLIADPALIPEKETAPKAAEAKAWLGYFLSKYAVGSVHAELRVLVKAAWDLANKVTHGDISHTDASAAAQAVVLVTRAVQQLRSETDGQTPPPPCLSVTTSSSANRVACHEYGTAVGGFLPRSWDHLHGQLWDHPGSHSGGSSVRLFDRRVRYFDVEVIDDGIQGGQCE